MIWQFSLPHFGHFIFYPFYNSDVHCESHPAIYVSSLHMVFSLAEGKMDCNNLQVFLLYVICEEAAGMSQRDVLCESEGRSF